MMDNQRPATDCHQYRHLLELRVDGRLGWLQQAELSQHLAECASCRRAEEELLTLARLFHELPKHRAPTQFDEAMRRRVAALRPSWASRPRALPPVWWRSLAWEAVIAMLVVGFSTAWVAHAGGWNPPGRLSRTTALVATVIAQEGRQLRAPGKVPLTDLMAMVRRNYQAWREAGVVALRSLRALSWAAPPGLGHAPWLAWALGGVLLLLNLLLEAVPLARWVGVRSTRRSSA